MKYKSLPTSFKQLIRYNSDSVINLEAEFETFTKVEK